jgi:hypothetical protein
MSVNLYLIKECANEGIVCTINVCFVKGYSFHWKDFPVYLVFITVYLRVYLDLMKCNPCCPVWTKMTFYLYILVTYSVMNLMKTFHMELCREIKMARLAGSYAFLQNLPRNF